MSDASSAKILKRILKQMKGYTLLLAATIFLALITVAGTIAVPVFFGRVIDLLDLTKFASVDFGKIFETFIIIGVIILITCVAQWLMGIINNRITFNIVKDIREEAFAKLQRLPLKYIDAHSYGDIVGRNIADVDQFADGLLMGFTQLFTGVLTIQIGRASCRERV